MSLFSDNDLEGEILLQANDYSGPSPTEAPLGLDASVPSMTPLFSQADLSTALTNGS